MKNALDFIFCSIASLALSGCAAGPAVYPASVLKSEQLPSVGLVNNIIQIALEVGFEAQPFKYEPRKAMVCSKQNHSLCIAVDVSVESGYLQIYEFEGSVAGASFTERSAQLLQVFETALQREHPGIFWKSTLR